jgi:hypothetical protein
MRRNEGYHHANGTHTVALPDRHSHTMRRGSYQPGHCPDPEGFIELAIRTNVGAEPQPGNPHESAEAM